MSGLTHQSVSYLSSGYGALHVSSIIGLTGRGELNADLLGIRMAELAEDVESLPPCVTRGIGVPVVMVDMAKQGERLRLAFGLADLPVQVAGLPIAGSGLVPVAEV